MGQRKAGDEQRSNPTKMSALNSQAEEMKKESRERRRLQNRASSQTYRQRRKKRLALLNRILEAEPPNAEFPLPIPPPGLAQIPEAQCFSAQDSETSGLRFTTSDDPLAAISANVPGQAVTALSDDNVCDIWLGNSENSAAVHTPEEPTRWTPLPSTHDPSGIPGPPLWDTGPMAENSWLVGDVRQAYPGLPLYPALPQQNTPVNTGLGFLDSVPHRENLSRVTKNMAGLTFEEKRQLLDMLRLEVTSEPLSNNLPSLPAFPPSEYTIQSNDSSSKALQLPGQAIATNPEMESTRFQIWLRSRALPQQAAAPAAPLASSNMRLSQISFWEALISNASYVSMQYEELGKMNGRSPFSDVLNEGVLGAHGRKDVSVPRDLRPTDAQIAHQHHPYIDLVPFASFRQRAVSALATDPPLVDWKQMCADINAAGIVCWVSGSNKPGEESTNLALNMTSDSRSWEPKVWFLKKYWFLVGGWEDEMWSSARWWAATRNEDITAE